MPAAFNSSAVLAPCLRMRSAVSVSFTKMIQSSGVMFSSFFTDKSAPSVSKSFTIYLRPFAPQNLKVVMASINVFNSMSSCFGKRPASDHRVACV